MNLIFFIIGFISCFVVVILFLIWVKHSNKVVPTEINDANKLHNIIGRLYRNGKNGETLFILDRISNFSIRIIKKKRKIKKDTLKIEIRASDNTTDGYRLAKKVLSNEGLVFKEKLTPKQKRPNRLYLKNNDGGMYIIPSIVNIVLKVMMSINSTKELDVLASYKDPFFWKKIKT